MSSKGVNKKQEISTATLRHVRIAPQKLRLILGLIKGKQVDPALRVLSVSSRKGARIVEKIVKSAIMNAKEVSGADVDNLWVNGAWVDEGRTIKRIMPRARGSASPILKRSSHITVVLGEK